MKKFLKSIHLILTLTFTFPLFSQQAVKAPFSKGVNLTMWFESWSKGIPNLRLYDEKDFADLAELGVDVVRLPIHFDMFIEDEKKGTVNPIIFTFLNKAADWAEKYKIYLIIDDHSFNSGKYPTSQYVKKHSLNVWPQIVEQFKNRSEYIIYEILNEPQIPQSEWYPIQKAVLDLIRSMDQKHTVVVTAADWGSLNTLYSMKPYEDDNLIYTFHYYDPFIFTHQGANWSSKEVEALKDVPFPYDKDRIPKVTGAAKNTWVENSLKYDYKNQATEEAMRKQLMKAVNFSNKYNVPVWDGEMGVYNLNAPYQDRVEWYKTAGKILQELNIPFCVWGYGTSFGIFKKGTAEVYPYDLDEQIVKGLGFNVPKNIGKRNPESNKAEIPFVFYDDIGGKNININAWADRKDNIYNLASNQNPAQDNYCIVWGNTNRYASMNFSPKNIDFSEIKNKIDSLTLTFYVNFTDGNQEVQVRFVDSEDVDKNYLPWRLSYNVKASEIGTGSWKKVEIPLSKMKVTGAWSNKLQKWYGPSSEEFSWERLENLQFTAEEKEIDGVIMLDQIEIK